MTPMADTWAQRGSDLKYGHGSALWKYWTSGEGFAKWSGAVHKWTTLRDLLLKAGVPAISADGLTTNIIQAVMPGYMKQAHAKTEHKAGRADMAKQDVTDKPVSRAEYTRLYPLENIEILRSEKDADGRPAAIVEAYAAVFGEPAEIKDHEGHYIEEIDRTAFDAAIAFAARNTGGLAGNIKVLYNHGLTVQGTPAPEFQLPIGVPIDIKPEARGLLTRTQYDAEDPFVQRLLGKIRQGSITAQSFVGRIIRSDPSLRPGYQRHPDRTGNLAVVRRMKLGLREYGPVLWPAYTGAEILGVRMSTPGGALDPDEELDDAQALPPDEGPASAGTDPLPEEEHSARYHQHALYALRSKEAREKAGLVW